MIAAARRHLARALSAVGGALLTAANRLDPDVVIIVEELAVESPAIVVVDAVADVPVEGSAFGSQPRGLA